MTNLLYRICRALAARSCLLMGALILSGSPALSQTNSAHQGPAASAPTDFSGKVSETMNTAGYTYFLVDTGKTKIWAAASQFSVKVGDKVAVGEGMPMPNYHSKTLNRDFELVVFTGNVTVNGVSVGAGSSALPKPAQLPAGHPPIPGAGAPAADSKPVINLVGIKKADGGKTIAEVYADKAKLSGKKVKVRGRVVKYNGDIMGKNWIHIQDGTGTAPGNDLAVTSAATTKVGDLIVINGAVAINKDFGGGYQYAVIVENAELSSE